MENYSDEDEKMTLDNETKIPIQNGDVPTKIDINQVRKNSEKKLAQILQNNDSSVHMNGASEWHPDFDNSSKSSRPSNEAKRMFNIELKNPNKELYQKMSSDLFQYQNKELQPVQVVSQYSEYISNTLDNELCFGEFLEDIHQLKCDESFILISNHIHPMIRKSFLLKYNQWDQPPISFTPEFSHGLVNSMAIKDSTSSKDTRIFVGFDSGHLIMLSGDGLDKLLEKQLCHNIITKVKIAPQQDRLICADMDGRMVLVDCLEDLEQLTYYDYAHCDGINDIAFDSNDNNNLAITCGQDQDILLWDFRLSRSDQPASLLTHVTTQPTSLCWPSYSGKHHCIVFGTEAGNIVQFDIRNKKTMKIQALFEENPFQSECDLSVTMIRPLKQDKYLAIMADNNHWVYDADLIKIIHQHEYPDGIQVRSCCQQKENDMLTIGYDSNVAYFRNCLV